MHSTQSNIFFTANNLSNYLNYCILSSCKLKLTCLQLTSIWLSQPKRLMFNSCICLWPIEALLRGTDSTFSESRHRLRTKSPTLDAKVTRVPCSIENEKGRERKGASPLFVHSFLLSLWHHSNHFGNFQVVRCIKSTTYKFYQRDNCPHNDEMGWMTKVLWGLVSWYNQRVACYTFL